MRKASEGLGCPEGTWMLSERVYIILSGEAFVKGNKESSKQPNREHHEHRLEPKDFFFFIYKKKSNSPYSFIYLL
jgi:hypothetical protein